MQRLYLENGYLNIPYLLSLNVPWVFVVGGRATGKTYGSLKHVIESRTKFIYMRRTQTQLDLINRPEFNPFKSVNMDMNWDITPQSISKYNSGFYHLDDNGKCFGEPVGYSMALTTISKMRGFDASDVELLIYDEFIPEKHEKAIKAEGEALENAYETINRNRELKGQKPLICLCLANANDLGNPIFMELGLISKAEKMRRKGREVSIDAERGVALIMLDNSEISKAKQDTALYRLTKGTDFEAMALSNEFADMRGRMIKPQPIAEFKAIAKVGEICLYKHKSNGMYYCTQHVQGAPDIFGSSEIELQRFWRGYSFIWEAYLKNKIYFEDSTCEVLLNKYV